LARYSITLTLYDEDEDIIILEKMWNEKITVTDFSQAISTRNYNYSYKSIELEPETYALRCEVVDKDSKKNFVITAIANVAEFDDYIGLSDLILVADKVQGKSGPMLIPSVSNKVTSNDSSLYFFYEIFADTSRSVTVHYSLQNNDEEQIYSQKMGVDVVKGSNFIEHEISDISFALGEFILIIQLEEDGDFIDRKVLKKLISHIYGFPASITDRELAVDQMTYIANNPEMDYILEGETYEIQLDRFKEYWKKKDPNPKTEDNAVLMEYFRRIEYANDHFKHYFDGWKTDMGMVYIVLGPPSNVERHPFDYDSKPYEMWDYYEINKRFVFIDQTGFGDYRLLDQQLGDWYRYRQ
ncbi:MAG: GWxTD domain-containing protein, partial [Candidatus Heimdallarchaeota archaeon]|nr:GWxTD domain-containing protein [Candidatus Heimdallarchaeota archaeon]